MKNSVLLTALAACLLLYSADAKIRVGHPKKPLASAQSGSGKAKATGAAKAAAALVAAASGSASAATGVGHPESLAQASSGKKPVVCVVRLDPNFHHAASFRHGWYNKYGSAFEYRLKQKNSDMKGCKYSISLVSFNQVRRSPHGYRWYSSVHVCGQQADRQAGR